MNDAKFYDIVYVIEFTISQFQSGSQASHREKKQNKPTQQNYKK